MALLQQGLGLVKHLFLTTLALFGSLALLSSCEKQGPLEKAGENLDHAATELTE